jgi:hypothetical protein
VTPGTRLALLLTLLLTAAFALAACGGDSKEDFANDADEICKEGEDKLDDVDRPSSTDEIPEYADETIEIAEDTKGELEDLDPPSEVEDDWNKYLDNVDEGIELIEDLGAAAERGDEEAVQELAQGDASDELEEENEEIADEIGLEQCGRSDDS